MDLCQPQLLMVASLLLINDFPVFLLVNLEIEHTIGDESMTGREGDNKEKSVDVMDSLLLLLPICLLFSHSPSDFDVPYMYNLCN